MRTTGPLVLLLLLGTSLPARAQVINGETPYDEDMLHQQAAASDSRTTAPRSPGQPARGEPQTAEPPAPRDDRD